MLVGVARLRPIVKNYCLRSENSNAFDDAEQKKGVGNCQLFRRDPIVSLDLA